MNWATGRSTYGLLGSVVQGDVHLLDLGLVDFLGRHVDWGIGWSRERWRVKEWMELLMGLDLVGLIM